MKSVKAKALVNKKECAIEGVADHVVKSVVDRLLSTQYDAKSKITGLIKTGGKNIVYVRLAQENARQCKKMQNNFEQCNHGYWFSKRLCESLGGKMAEEITKKDFDRLHDVMYFQGESGNDNATSYFVGARSSMKEGKVESKDRTRSSFTWLSGKPVDENVWSAGNVKGKLWFDIGAIQFKDIKVSYKGRPGGLDTAASSWAYATLCLFD